MKPRLSLDLDRFGKKLGHFAKSVIKFVTLVTVASFCKVFMKLVLKYIIGFGLHNVLR